MRFLVALLLLLTAPALHAQTRDGAMPRLSPSAMLGQRVGLTDVTITYGRPAVNGRVVYGALVPYGEVWRTGADEATTITFSTDVLVEGQPLAAGTYGLFTVPGPATWAVVFNTTPQQWGAYEYDEAQDALRVSVRPEAAPMQERLAFTADAVDVEEAVFAVEWAGVRVPFRVRTDTAARWRAAAAAAVAADAANWRVPLGHAQRAAQLGRYTDDGLRWAEQAVALEANYATLSTRARLLAAAERWPEAVASGERALAAGRAMDEAPNGLAGFEAALAEWRTRVPSSR